MTTWQDRIAARLASIEEQGRWRTIRTLDDGPTTTTVTATGEKVTSFASNDYLGLTHHPRVLAAAHAALDEFGTGSGAARLIVGGRPPHDELEAELAGWTGREAALLFPTGYQANVGVLGALARVADRPLILSDELNHASIIDGARLARAEVEVFRHVDATDLDVRLGAAGDRSAIVVTDSVFSMDGDVAPLGELVDVCRAHGALLVVDEAHAVLGPSTPTGDDVVTVGTLSKALGSVGGFVAGTQAVVDLCRNTARSFIFTTAGPPADAAAALAALRVVRSDEGAALRARLREHIDLVRPGHPSPIIPVLLGDEARAVAVADQLLSHGLLVPAIRPPTVAPGSCRLRVALSATHTTAMVQQLVDLCAQLEVPLHG